VSGGPSGAAGTQLSPGLSASQRTRGPSDPRRPEEPERNFGSLLRSPDPQPPLKRNKRPGTRASDFASPRRLRAKPCVRTPQVRKSRNSCSTNAGSRAPSAWWAAIPRNVSRCSATTRYSTPRSPMAGRLVLLDRPMLLVQGDRVRVLGGRLTCRADAASPHHVVAAARRASRSPARMASRSRLISISATWAS